MIASLPPPPAPPRPAPPAAVKLVAAPAPQPSPQPVSIVVSRRVPPPEPLPPPATTSEAIARVVRGGPVDTTVPVVASALGMARAMMAPPSAVSSAQAQPISAQQIPTALSQARR